MKTLFDIQQVMMEQFDAKLFMHRCIFDSISLDNAITGILGARGVGKTTYLLHKIAEHPQQGLYVSADNPFFLRHSLLQVADYLYKETDITLFCIDEIHKYPNWQQEIKNIADIYKKIKIIFTGSSMIDIIHSQFDLSRRVTLHYFGGLSFREYLVLTLQIKLPTISIEDIFTKHTEFAKQLPISGILKYFRRYLSSGYYFFFKELSLEQDRLQAIQNISQKIIYEDIALLHQVKSATLATIEKLYKFVLCTNAGELNINKLAKLIEKSYDQTTEYLNWLNQSGLINAVYINKIGKALVKSAKKLLPENTNLISAAYLTQTNQDIIGKLRETFLINQLKNAKHNIFYTNIGDYLINENTIEVGGRNKTAKQIKSIDNSYIVADNILVGDNKTIPLYLFGFLY